MKERSTVNLPTMAIDIARRAAAACVLDGERMSISAWIVRAISSQARLEKERRARLEKKREEELLHQVETFVENMGDEDVSGITKSFSDIWYHDGDFLIRSRGHQGGPGVKVFDSDGMADAPLSISAARKYIIAELVRGDMLDRINLIEE